MISIGKVLSWHEWKFADGVRHVERAVALSPNNAEAHWVLATALPVVGRLADGIAAVRRALELDPLRVEMAQLGHDHVGVTTICPSVVDTGLCEGVPPLRLTTLLSPEDGAKALEAFVGQLRAALA